jgi:hypothetical protein
MLSLKECQDLANDKQGLCLSTEYINQGTSMQWKCKKNHTWPSTFKNIRKGTWCPFCAIEINDSDIVLFTDLITIYKYNLKYVHYDERKIVWKDFLLLFKKEFHHKISDVYTGKISSILRKMLYIDQKKHVESFINLTFTEWIDRFTPF